MREIKLKPCPFCGGEAVTSLQTTDPENKFAFGWIGCQKCRCFINYINNAKGLKEAAEAWDRRADNRHFNPLPHTRENNRTKLISTGVARTAEEGWAYVVKKHITVKIPYCSICGERGDNAKGYKGVAVCVEDNSFCSYGERTGNNGKK